jgi:hypothetical protein
MVGPKKGAPPVFDWYKATEKDVLAYARNLVDVVTSTADPRPVVLELARVLSTPEQPGEIRVGDRVFPTRAAVRDYCREVLEETDGEVAQEHVNCLRALFATGPRGRGRAVSGPITVDVHPFMEVRCFFVRGEDGAREDVSFTRCAAALPCYATRIHEYARQCLEQVISNCPMADAVLAESLDKACPFFFTEPLERIRDYVGAVYKLAEEHKHLREPLVRVTVKWMVAMDGEIAKMEADESGGRNEGDMDVRGQKLDAMICLLFEYLGCDPESPHVAVLDVLDPLLLHGLLLIFSQVVLPVRKCRYVQFVWFRIASALPLTAEAFLTVCLSALYDPAISLSTRCNAANYLGSFVCRASKVPPSFACRVCEYLLELLHECQLRGDNPREVPERKLHQVVVQNLFYIFCWHADSPIEYGRLLGGEKGLLTYCRRAEVHAGWVHDEIRRQFMKVTCRNETLAQLLEVLERPGPALFEEVDDTEERHEIAFPFDPCQLRNAHQFIFQFYREWEDGVDGDDAGLTSSAVTSSVSSPAHPPLYPPPRPRASTDRVFSFRQGGVDGSPILGLRDPIGRQDPTLRRERTRSPRANEGLGPEWTAGVEPSPALRPMRRRDDDRGGVRANQLANEMSPLSSSPLGGFELPQSAFSLDGYDEDTPTDYQLSSDNALGLFINDPAFLAADKSGRRK